MSLASVKPGPTEYTSPRHPHQHRIHEIEIPAVAGGKIDRLLPKSRGLRDEPP